MSTAFAIELRIFEKRLAVALSRLGDSVNKMPPIFSPREGRYEGWLICSWAHALKHGMRIPVLVDRDGIPILTDEGWNLYKQLGRAHPGEDLVYAIGDIQ